MKYTNGKIYHFIPELNEEGFYTFSHYNEYGSAFFILIGGNQEIDQLTMVSACESEQDVMIEV